MSLSYLNHPRSANMDSKPTAKTIPLSKINRNITLRPVSVAIKGKFCPFDVDVPKEFPI